MYINRAIEKTIIKLSKEYPVIMLCGQRQVGKSTVLNHIKKGTIGNIIDIVKSRFVSNKKGYILELPEYSDFDLTFIFEEDEIVKTKKD